MIVYKIDNTVYINLTNRCSNQCEFCVRTTSDVFEEFDLWLEKEPTTEEVILELKKYLDYNDFVFCGYGEPLYRLDSIVEIGEFLREKGKTVRLNTNGQADLIVGSGVAKRLKEAVDKVSISLNASTPTAYQSICHSEFGEKAFSSLINFAKECKENFIYVQLSIVDCIGVQEIEDCQKLADSINVPLKIRKFITN